MKLEDLDKVEKILDFSNDSVYIMVLIARKKNNDMISNSKEIVMRKVIRNIESFRKQVHEFTAIADSKTEEFKLYISCNPRSPLKAYKLLKTYFSNWDYDLLTEGGKDVAMGKIKKIGDIDISCLAKSPEVKNYFMLDLDDKEESSNILLLMIKSLIKTEGIFETKNGYHILFKPCDTRNLMGDIKKAGIDCELKKDDLLCIGYEE